MSGGRNSFKIRADTSGFKSLLHDIKEAAAGAVRPAAQAGAQTLYDEVHRNVDRIGRVTGNLKSAIYQVYSKANSVDGERATYHVSWNASKAPHGHLVEYGHMQKYRTVQTKDGNWVTLKDQPLQTPRQVGARPFVRPAQAKFSEATEAAKDVLLKRIDEATK